MKNLRLIILLGCLVVFESCSEDQEEQQIQILNAVLANLEEIKSANFSSYTESWAPGDTIPAVTHYSQYIAYNNPADTTLGASWVVLNNDDTTQIEFVYDGKMRASIYRDEKGIVIDSFKVRKLPFRPTKTPFYWYTREILKYALTTEDSISLDFKENGDMFCLRLTIHEDQQVEFFGRAYYIPEPPYGYQDPTSRYELWINKTTMLPYKYQREMEHNISSEEVSKAEFNKLDIDDFIAASYFPAGYEIRQYGQKSRVPSPHELLGKKAPEWVLTDEYGGKIALNEFESKVVLIQFTSVNCGPCRASIPFLNELASRYNREDLGLIAIESYTKNTNVLSSYRKRTGLNYKFVMSEEEVNSTYSIAATPIFFILDKDRIIREIFRGYGGDSTEIKITDSIDRLI